jgi:hypothetical protein
MIDARRNADPTAVNSTNLIDAYARFSDPHRRISMYIGTRTISKNAKNRSRSIATKTPRTPVSRMSIRMRYVLRRSVTDRDAAIAIGKSSVVRTMRKSEMPSTATRQPTSSEDDSVRSSPNWKAAVPTVKFHTR